MLQPVSLTQLIFFIIAIEIFRRVICILLLAYTGPLSRIPGPWWSTLSDIPITYLNLRGTQCRNTHWREGGWFREYAPKDLKGRGVVRIAPRELIVADYDGVQKILVEDDMIKAKAYELTQAVYPGGKISHLHNERDRVRYKQKRRLLSTGFSISYINGLEPLMKDCMKVFEEMLDGKITEAESFGEKRAVLDVQLAFGNLTADVMTATSFGGSFNLVRSDSPDFRNMMAKKLYRTALHEFLPFLRYLPFVPTMHVKEFDDMLDGIVAKRRTENQERKMRGEESKKDLLQVSDKKLQFLTQIWNAMNAILIQERAQDLNITDMIKIFIEANESDPINYTNYHIREDLVVFMIAGSDTTSMSSVFALQLLLNNPDKLRKLQAEIKQAFPHDEEEITFANTQDMKYLNAVIYETERVMPILQCGVPRETEADTIISGYEVPKGTLVFAAIGALLNDPAIWPEPELFLPERWLTPHNGVPVNKKAYYPFSTGRHSCIGQQFALKELRLILVTILRRYEISLVEGQSHALLVSTTPYMEQGFYNVGFRKRKHRD